MLTFNKFNKFYLYRPFVDFRKGAAGLSAIVQDQMNLNPFDQYLFIFCNRSRNKIKILYWDHNGFALWYKTLVKEKYFWPSNNRHDNIIVNEKKLKSFLKGLNPWQPTHKKFRYDLV